MKLVGKVKEAHGLRGELHVLIFSGDVSWLPRLKEFGLGALPPRGEDPAADAVQKILKCQKAKPFKNGLIVKAEELTDRNAAEAVEKWGFYIADELLVSEEGEGIYLEEIRGFTVKDATQTTLGRIVDFSSNGVQDLLVLEKAGGGEAEIPFVDAFLKKIDFKSKTVVMDLPEGLLDLGKLDEA
ncbi:MAG: 16S rRNA processing protein RimM [Bdellovibrionaceae bacterium]|nr:16S rRNA processing protein RimM [Pseudobdellovibrionaceae bacterium]